MKSKATWAVLILALHTLTIQATVPTLDNFQAETAGEDELLLEWTTPLIPIAGNGQYAGDRDIDLAFDLRYDTSPITDGSWATASQLDDPPALGV